MDRYSLALRGGLDGISRRSFLKGTGTLAGGAALGLIPSSAALASNWKPTGRVEIVVPVGAGGGTDITARTIQQIMQQKEIVEQPMTIVNMPGGGGAIGMEYLVNQAPDGHTICVHSGQLVQSHIAGRAPFTYTDITPIAFLAQQVVSFAVRTDSDIESAEDLVQRLRADPQSVSISIGSTVGNYNHIAIAMVAKEIGVDPMELRTVVFASGAEGMTATLGGHVDVGITSSEQFLPHVESGDLKFLAVAAAERMGGDMADVPTWREFDIDCVAGNWYAAFGPPDMGEPQLAFWDDAFGRLAASQEWQSDVASRNMRDSYLDSAGAGTFFQEEYDRLQALMSELGLAG